MTSAIIKICISYMICIAWISCTPAISQRNTTEKVSKQFRDYWYQGEAELTRYSLEQARYGEVHEGEAVLIFVTEDFDTKKQVKFEYGNRDKVASVLKLNFTKKFFTGLYPYSMMTSVFTPVNQSQSIKVTTTSQEWCGHTFSQLNLGKNEYKGRLHSYFQNEGDQEFSIEDVMLEDELWTRIRLDPNTLPIGEIDLIPGTMFLRLGHADFQAQKARAELSPEPDSELSANPVKKYTISFNNLNRTLDIWFEEKFPYQILAWEEQVQSGFGANKKTLTTRAVKTHSIKNAYWEKNNLADSDLREQLGLNPSNY